MASAGDVSGLVEATVFLGAAVVAVPAFKKLGLGSVLGYLAAGMAIGPFGLAAVSDPEAVLHFAEFGVVLLLFIIGLELRPQRLWRMRVAIFGLGASQVLATGAIITGALMLVGLVWQQALIIGLALALSSTAFGVQILREKGHLTLPYGDRSFSILLFQDLAIVPLLALVPILAPDAGGEASSSYPALIAIGALVALVVGGRFGLQPLFRMVARAGADEVFTAAALFVVIFSALLMEYVGLSMAMGAFIAGVLLADTEFRHQLETDIEPFRGLLLGLFFMSFGMTLDWNVVAENWWIVLLGAPALYLLKAAAIWSLSRIFGANHADALRSGAVLGQGGEFGFVLFATAATVSLVSTETKSILSALITASMIITPFAIMAVDRFLSTSDEESPDGFEDASHAPRSRIIVAGFGRVGQVIARIMRLRGYEVTLIDNSTRRIRMAESFGSKVYYGDATRLDVLRSAGAEQARIIFLCIDDRDGAKHAVDAIRERFPNAMIFADTYDRFSELELLEAGAEVVVRETFESAVELARQALIRLGDEDAIEEIFTEFRRRDAELQRMQMEYGAHEGLKRLREKYEAH